MDLTIDDMHPEDWAPVRQIYLDGLASLARHHLHRAAQSGGGR